MAAALSFPLQEFQLSRLQDVEMQKYSGGELQIVTMGASTPWMRLITPSQLLVREFEATHSNIRIWKADRANLYVTFTVSRPALLADVKLADADAFERLDAWRRSPTRALTDSQPEDALRSPSKYTSPFSASTARTTPLSARMSPQKSGAHLSPKKRGIIAQPKLQPIAAVLDDESTAVPAAGSVTSQLAQLMSSSTDLSDFRSSFARARPLVSYARGAPLPLNTLTPPRSSTSSSSKSATTAKSSSFSPPSSSPPSSSPPLSRALTMSKLRGAWSTIQAPISPSPSRSRGEGLRNLGNTCYMNATLQALAHLRPFTRDMLDESLTSSSIAESSLYRAFVELLRAKQAAHSAAVDPARFTNAVFRALPFTAYEQEDAHEFLSATLNELDKEVAPHATSPAGVPEDASPVWRNFRATVINTLVCDACGRAQQITDALTDLTLQPSAGADGDGARELTELLRAAFEEERVAYACEACGAPRATLRHQMGQLPRILVIHLNRFRVADGAIAKDNSPIALAAHIDLAPYCSPETRSPTLPTPRKRRAPLQDIQPNRVKRRLFDMSDGPISEADADEEALQEALARSRHDDELQRAIDQSLVEHEEAQARKRARQYRLVGIVSHVGDSVSSGHYVCDVLDDQASEWTCYDDERVTPGASTGRTLMNRRQTAYMLFYISEALAGKAVAA